MISQNNSKNSFVKLLLLLSFLAFCALQCGTPKKLTVDNIIQKNIDARGGAEKWTNLKTIYMEGTYTSFSEPKPFKVWRQRPDLYRFDSNRIGQDVIHVYDGENAWWSNPLMGPQFEKPQVIPSKGNLDKVTLRERFFEPVFWNYQEKSNQVVLEGREIFDDKDSYKLKVTLADSSIEFWYIDTKTFLVNAMTGDTYDFGLKNHLDVYFSEYTDVEGIKFPFLIESEYGQRYRTMEVEKLEINKEIDPAVFKMPTMEE